jgi:hypothetical protein
MAFTARLCVRARREDDVGFCAVGGEEARQVWSAPVGLSLASLTTPVLSQQRLLQVMNARKAYSTSAQIAKIDWVVGEGLLKIVPSLTAYSNISNNSILVK